jgi:hypothetical protein
MGTAMMTLNNGKMTLEKKIVEQSDTTSQEQTQNSTDGPEMEEDDKMMPAATG